jgi:hypothetical protein
MRLELMESETVQESDEELIPLGVVILQKNTAFRHNKTQ